MGTDGMSFTTPRIRDRLRLAEKTRSIASSWDQQHKQLLFNHTKDINASPTKGIKSMARAVGSPPANSLKFVKRDGKTADGKAAGTITANQTTIDGIIARAWREILRGNSVNLEQCVDIFIQKHGRVLHKIFEVEATDITTSIVFQALNVAGHLTVSMDGVYLAACDSIP